MSVQDTELKQNSRHQNQPLAAEAIEEWMIAYFSKQLDINPAAVAVEESFDSYGLDSAEAVVLAGAMEEWLGFQFDPTMLYDYPTIAKLARYLAQESLRSE